MHQIRGMSSCFLGNLHRLDEGKLSKMGQMVKKNKKKTAAAAVRMSIGAIRES